jgi:hypothetical protein
MTADTRGNEHLGITQAAPKREEMTVSKFSE